MRTPQTKSRQIAIAAVFAALYFVLRSLPNPIPFLFQMVGISGRFTAGDFMLTTVALVAGLWGGTISVLVGTALAYPVNGPVFFGLDFLPGVMNILVTGLVLENHRRIARGVFIIVLFLFLASPYSLLFGFSYVPFVWLHLLALAVLLSPAFAKVPDWIVRNDSHQLVAVVILAFVGTMAQHLTGGLLYEMAVGLVEGNSQSVVMGYWRVIFWLYPSERILLTIVSTIISVGALRAIRRLGL
jgi:hypothetical protein